MSFLMTPSSWCIGIVITSKKPRSVRICDRNPLNVSVLLRKDVVSTSLSVMELTEYLKLGLGSD